MTFDTLIGAAGSTSSRQLAASARPVLSAEVEGAIRAGHPVVALESTLITHGFPRPRNLEVARRAEAAVRAAGAVPATIAVLDGHLRVGLGDADLEHLANRDDARKASRQHLAAVVAAGATASTTVSATMIAAHLAEIGVFATGGIGGVHRGALGGGRGDRQSPGDAPTPADRPTFDISADLEELARTPVVVVCSGPKSILDAALSLEYLETRGVPVVGFGTSRLPGFWSRETDVPVPVRVDSPAEAAMLVRCHRELGLTTGIVLAVPVPADAAMPRLEADEAIREALAAAVDAGIRGSAFTPWVLRQIADRTGGRSVEANVALIVHNAEVAAWVATALGAMVGRLSAGPAGIQARILLRTSGPRTVTAELPRDGKMAGRRSVSPGSPPNSRVTGR